MLLLPLSSLLLTRKIDLEDKTLLRNIMYISNVGVYAIVLHYSTRNILYARSNAITIYYKTITKETVN